MRLEAEFNLGQVRRKMSCNGGVGGEQCTEDQDELQGVVEQGWFQDKGKSVPVARDAMLGRRVR